MSFQVFTSDFAHIRQTPGARSKAPIQLNFIVSKRTPWLPHSGDSGMVECTMPM